MKFTFVQSNPFSDRPTVTAVIKFLNKQKNGKLIDGIDLSDALNLNRVSIRENARYYKDYWHLHKGKRWFGNKRTIQALRKELDENGNGTSDGKVTKTGRRSKAIQPGTSASAGGREE